jgi:hypothetical protein
MDTFTVARQSQTINSSGFAVNTPTVTPPLYGVVTSDQGKRLQRGTDAERIAQTITIITTFELSAGAGTGQTADVVNWNGQQYTVTHIDDYSRFGQGFIQATCELQSVNG